SWISHGFDSCIGGVTARTERPWDVRATGLSWELVGDVAQFGQRVADACQVVVYVAHPYGHWATFSDAALGNVGQRWATWARYGSLSRTRMLLRVRWPEVVMGVFALLVDMDQATGARLVDGRCLVAVVGDPLGLEGLP